MKESKEYELVADRFHDCEYRGEIICEKSTSESDLWAKVYLAYQKGFIRIVNSRGERTDALNMRWVTGLSVRVKR